MNLHATLLGLPPARLALTGQAGAKCVPSCPICQDVTRRLFDSHRVCPRGHRLVVCWDGDAWRAVAAVV
jgi:hypothetical protein